MNEEEIILVPYSEDELLTEGSYLVKSESTSKCGSTMLKSVQYLQVRLTNVFNEKKKREVNRLDMTNQIPLLISTKSIKLII